MKQILCSIVLFSIGLANTMAQTWFTTTLKPPSQGNYNDIVFVSNHHGFILGDNNIFLETWDAGKTWSNNSPFKESEKDKSTKKMIFLNDTLGFFMTNFFLYQTKNEGKTWEVANYGGYGVKDMDVFQGQFTVYSDQAFGQLLTSQYSVEHDTFSYNSGFFPIYTLEHVRYVGDSNLVYSKDSGRIYLSKDFGKTAIKVYDPMDDGLQHIRIADIHFLNKDTGFASLNYVWIKKTVDGGKTWFTDTNFNFISKNSVTTKVFSMANGTLFLNAVSFNATNYFYKFIRATTGWERETQFADANLSYGSENYAGIAGNGTGLYSVFMNDTLAYKTEFDHIKNISKMEENKFTVYPNPSKGNFVLHGTIENNEMYHWRIVDALGQEVELMDINSSPFSFHIHQKGIYFAWLMKGSEILGQQKLIVE